MRVGEMMAAVLVLLLALYGCAGLIRRVCLWLTRCPGCAYCCRLAVPRHGAAMAPLVRCLQGQSVWDDPTGCWCTLLLLPDSPEETPEELERILREAPAVVPVTAARLMAMLEQLAEK